MLCLLLGSHACLSRQALYRHEVWDLLKKMDKPTELPCTYLGFPTVEEGKGWVRTWLMKIRSLYTFCTLCTNTKQNSAIRWPPFSDVYAHLLGEIMSKQSILSIHCTYALTKEISKASMALVWMTAARVRATVIACCCACSSWHCQDWRVHVISYTAHHGITSCAHAAKLLFFIYQHARGRCLI